MPSAISVAKFSAERCPHRIERDDPLEARPLREQTATKSFGGMGVGEIRTPESGRVRPMTRRGAR